MGKRCVVAAWLNNYFVCELWIPQSTLNRCSWVDYSKFIRTRSRCAVLSLNSFTALRKFGECGSRETSEFTLRCVSVCSLLQRSMRVRKFSRWIRTHQIGSSVFVEWDTCETDWPPNEPNLKVQLIVARRRRRQDLSLAMISQTLSNDLWTSETAYVTCHVQPCSVMSILLLAYVHAPWKYVHRSSNWSVWFIFVNVQRWMPSVSVRRVSSVVLVDKEIGSLSLVLVSDWNELISHVSFERQKLSIFIR